MFKFLPHLCTTLLLLRLATVCAAQASPQAAFPIEVQRDQGQFYFVARPELMGFRVALYDQTGSLRADSEALTAPPLRWQLPKLAAGIYVCVFWLRGQGRAEKTLARLEVRATTLKLQEAGQYLEEARPSNFAPWGTPEARAVERRAQARGSAALPFFRTATKVLPEDSAAWLLLVRAFQIKYARFEVNLLAPPPPPPVAARKRTQTKPAPRLEITWPQPTAAEQQEMLAACQKAVAVAKTCAEKTNSLLWLAALQAELDQTENRIATLEQIAQASCATNEIKAQSWYTIGVLQWQCSYDLTTRYADRARTVSDPFHYRNITKAADQQRAANCLQKGLEMMEKAIALNPEYAEAWSYRSLLYREQQKLTASETERRTISARAEEAARRAVELTAKQRNR